MDLTLLLLFWGAVLWYVARAQPETLQLTWLVVVALVLASPLIAVFWPAFR